MQVFVKDERNFSDELQLITDCTNGTEYVRWMKGWSGEQDCDFLFSLRSDGVHRGGHPVLPVRLTDGQPAKLSSEQLVPI